MGQHRKEHGVFRLSEREEAVIDVLERGHALPNLAPAARDAIEMASKEWEQGRLCGPDLLADAIDADARLWIVRLDPLDRLSRLTQGRPDGGPAVPLEALLALGDPTPRGWGLAFAEVFTAATGPAPSSSRTGSRRSAATAGSRGSALEHFEADAEAYATGLWNVRFPSLDGMVMLSVPGRAQAGQPLGADGHLQCGIRYQTPTRAQPDVWRVAPADWRAIAALIAGLWAVERLALPPGRREFARRVLRQGLVRAVRASAARPDESTGRRVVEAVVGDLESAVLKRGRRRPRSLDWTWPSAFALVAGALDRFAGLGSEPFASDPPVGAWVDVFDPDGREWFGSGLVVDRDELPARPVHDAWRRLRRKEDEELVPVRVDGDVRGWPRTTLWTPRRAQLFDDGIVRS